MIDPEMKKAVLKYFYDRYFQISPYLGIFYSQIDDIVSGNRNDIEKTIHSLMLENSIEDHDGFYRITANGIDVYEELYPSIIGKKIEQREIILQLLKESYDEDIHRSVVRSTILDKIKDIDKNELLAQMEYLNKKGLIELDVYSNNFTARLSATGYQFFEQYEKYDH